MHKECSCNRIIRFMVASKYEFKDGAVRKPNGEKMYVRKSDNPKRYHHVQITCEHKRYTIQHSRLVCWLANIEPPTEYHFVHHRNGNRHDDSPENLEWINRAENARLVSPETAAQRVKNLRSRAEKARRAKRKAPVYLHDTQKVEICHKYESGLYTIRELAEEYGPSSGTISRTVRKGFSCEEKALDLKQAA